MKVRAFWSLLLSLAFLGQASAAKSSELQPEPWSTPIDITGGATENWVAFSTAVCDRFQNLHVFWIDNGVRDSAIYYRNDLHDEWSQPRDIVVAPDRMDYFLDAVTANDSLHLVWSAATGGLYYTTSSIAHAGEPAGWSMPLLLDEPVYNASMAVDTDGALHLMYGSPDPEGLHYDVIHRSSEDNGVTWSSPRVVFSTAFSRPSYIRTEMAIDAANRIHVGLTLREQQYGRYSEVGYLRSEAGGQTWGTYRMLERRANDPPGLEWIAPFAFGENEVHLTWHNPRRMDQWSMDGGTTWSEPIEIAQLGAAFGGPNALARDSAGTTYAVTAWANGVYVSRWYGSYWSVDPVAVDLRNIDPHGQHITVCQGNVLHVLYDDRTGDNAVWYSSWVTPARHLARLPLPEEATPTSRPTAVPALSMATSVPETSPSLAQLTATPGSVEPLVPAPSPVTPLLLGALSVLALLAAVVAGRMRKLRL